MHFLWYAVVLSSFRRFCSSVRVRIVGHFIHYSRNYTAPSLEGQGTVECTAFCRNCGDVRPGDNGLYPIILFTPEVLTRSDKCQHLVADLRRMSIAFLSSDVSPDLYLLQVSTPLYVFKCAAFVLQTLLGDAFAVGL